MVNTQKVKKLALNSQLLTVQILTNDVQVLMCISYFITTVKCKMVYSKDMKGKWLDKLTTHK